MCNINENYLPSRKTEKWYSPTAVVIGQWSFNLHDLDYGAVSIGRLQQRKSPQRHFNGVKKSPLYIYPPDYRVYVPGASEGREELEETAKKLCDLLNAGQKIPFKISSRSKAGIIKNRLIKYNLW